jgi:hypothetical protein
MSAEPDDELEPDEPDAWYLLPEPNLAEFFLGQEALLDDEGYVPEDATRARMVTYAEHLRSTGSKKLAAAATGWSMQWVREMAHAYPPFKALQEFALQSIAGKVRAALVMKAIGAQQNVHAQIHLDRLMSREDYEVEAQRERPALRIAISATVRPGTIPVGDPTQVIDVSGHITGMEAELGGSSTDRHEALGPGWLDTDDRRLLAPAGEDWNAGTDDGDPEELQPEDGEL